MNWRQRLPAVFRIQPGALSPGNVGALPVWAKLAAMLAAFVFALAAGYPWLLAPGRERLALAQHREAELHRDHQRKAAESAALSAYHARHAGLKSMAAELLRQLPRDVEIPHLLEDITASAEGNGLVMRSLDLEPERPAGFYAELPMAISVDGGYHEIGAFVGQVAGLPRIVTLHDFDLAPAEPDAAGESVRIHVTARIYRRIETEVGEP